MRPASIVVALLAFGLLCSCETEEDPYAHWPADGSEFPYLYTPETDLEPYEEVRWETETWDPGEDLDMTALYVLKSVEHRPGAPLESLEHFEAMRPQVPAPGGGVRLSLVGDVMWIGDNWAEYATPVAGLLDGDLRVGNLETPTSAEHPTELAKLGSYTFNAPPEMLDGLPLDLLQLNNNHSIDVGDAGLENTVAEVEERGLEHTGVDRQRILEVGGRRIALLAYTWGLNQRDTETAHELHVIPFGHLDEEIDLSSLEEDVAAARADGADSLVALLHWGYEYEYYPDPHFMVLARRIVAAGVDLVVGSGPHVVQPAEICHVNRPDRIPGIGTCSIRTHDGEPRTAAVLYSLGNFGTIMATVPCQVGLVASVTLDPDVTGLGWTAVATVDDPPWVRPLADLLDDGELAAESTRLEGHLGPDWRL